MGSSKRFAGLIFVLVGPGGAGKNAIMKAIIAENAAISQLATATTRQMRADEEQGREHVFVDEGEFKRMIATGQLLEYQEVTPGKFYGIPKQSVLHVLESGLNRIADIEVYGAQDLAAAYPENVIQIFVTVPGETIAAQLEVLERRMRGRADFSTDINQRLQRAKLLELPYQSQCDHVVVNDQLGEAIAKTRAIIEAEVGARSRLNHVS